MDTEERREQIAAYRAAHREELRKYIAAYYTTHKEELLKSQAVYNASHKEEQAVYQKAYYAAHKEEKLKYSLAYHTSHREERLKYNLAQYAVNNEEIRKTNAAFKKAHKEATNMNCQIRRAQKAGLARTLTTSQWAHILNEFNNTCAYCGAGDKTLHQEHFIPLSAGGEYTHNNIIPACKNCNCSKRNKSFWDWYPTSRCYDSQREKKVMKFLHYVGEAQQLTMTIPYLQTGE